MDKKYILSGTIGTILLISVVLGVTLTTTDYRQLLEDHPNATYIMINYNKNSKIEFITHGINDFLRWKMDKNKLTLYDARYIGVQSDWIVEYWKTYGEDKWVRINRKRSLIDLSYTNTSDSITVTKTTPYYAYASNSGNGGLFYDNFTVTDKSSYINFPSEYVASWIPSNHRQDYLHRLTWRLKELEPLPNTPTGNLTNIYSMEFGHNIKVDWSTAKNQVDYAEYDAERQELLVHFLPREGNQFIDVRATDPVSGVLLLYLDGRTDRRYYEEGNNANIYAELVNLTHDTLYNNSVYNRTGSGGGPLIEGNSQDRVQFDIDNVYNCTLNLSLARLINPPDGNLTLQFGDYTNTTAVTVSQAGSWAPVTFENLQFDIPDYAVFNKSQVNLTLSCPNCNTGYSWEENWPVNTGGKSFRSSDGGSTWSTTYNRLALLSCSNKTNINETIYLSMNHPVLGTNFTSGYSPLEYTWSNTNSSTITFSDGTSSKNVIANTSLTYSAHALDKFSSATVDIFAESDVRNLEIDVGANGNIDHTIGKVRGNSAIIDGDTNSAKNVTIFGAYGTNATTISIIGNQTYSVGKINITGYNKSAAIVDTIAIPSNTLQSLAVNKQYLFTGEISDGQNITPLYRIRLIDGAITANESRCAFGGCMGLGVYEEGDKLYSLWTEVAGSDLVTRYSSIDLSGQVGMLPSGVQDAAGLTAETNNSIWLGGYKTGDDVIVSSNTEMYGTHYYNSFQVTNGATVTIADKNATEGTGYLKIYAKENITICSTCTINGAGAGYAGGAGGVVANNAGEDGNGPQYGEGGANYGGAGAGAYGVGGSTTQASGGSGGNSSFSIGSGGGGGEASSNTTETEHGGAGGNGGAALYLTSQLIDLNGSIDLSGNAGQIHDIDDEGSGGGGAGGYCKIIGNIINIADDVLLDVSGGDAGTSGVGRGGGGGGAGTIKVYGAGGNHGSSSYNIDISGGVADPSTSGSENGGIGYFAEPSNSAKYGYEGAELWNFYWNGTAIQHWTAETSLAIFNSTMDIQGLAYDSTNDQIWIADDYHDKIWAMGTDGHESSSLSFDSPVKNMRGLGWADKYLYVLNATAVYKISLAGTPDEIKVDIGNDGVWEYEGSSFGESTLEIDNLTAVQNYVDSYCTSSNCELPIRIYSGNPSIYQLSFGTTDTDSYMAYSLSSLNLNTTAIENSLTGDSYTTFPVYFNASTWGNLIVNNTVIYYNGSSNYTVTANYYGPTYTPTSDTNELNVVWSNFTITKPYSYMEFTPVNLSQKDVQPYGQNSTMPFWNITAKGYDSPFNLSIKLNESLPSCLNLSVGNSSILRDNLLLTDSWQDYTTNLNYNDTISAWFSLDLTSCDRSIVHALSNMKLQLKSCCVDCVSCG